MKQKIVNPQDPDPPKTYWPGDGRKKPGKIKSTRKTKDGQSEVEETVIPLVR